MFASWVTACKRAATDPASHLRDEAAASFDGVATHFDGLGDPYGGCGVPQAQLETPYFVALNVQDTPDDYTSFLPRPFAEQSKIGTFDNGRNCGRWVHVTIGNFCSGATNSGQPGAGLCKGGTWVADEFNGAQLDLLVADSCQDGNVWCRDSRYHLDLSTASIEKFKPGLGNKWGNRQISWRYITAPGYQGDIRIAFRQNASPGWPAIIITHLQNGLHGVEQQTSSGFQALKMDSDMGQSYVMQASTGPFRIRLTDADDHPAQGGRIYEFSFPSTCGGGCPNAFNEVKYTTTGGSSQKATQQPTPTPVPPNDHPVTPPNPTPPNDHPVTPPATTQPSGSPGLTAEVRVKSNWASGFCADLVVHNGSGAAVKGWTVTLQTGTAKLNQQWNISITPTTGGYQLKPTDTWNAQIAVGADSAAQGFCADTPNASQVSVAGVSAS